MSNIRNQLLSFSNFPLSEPTFASKSIIDKFGINDSDMC